MPHGIISDGKNINLHELEVKTRVLLEASYLQVVNGISDGPLPLELTNLSSFLEARILKNVEGGECLVDLWDLAVSIPDVHQFLVRITNDGKSVMPLRILNHKQESIAPPASSSSIEHTMN